MIRWISQKIHMIEKYYKQCVIYFTSNETSSLYWSLLIFLDFILSKRFLVAENDKTKEKIDHPINMLDFRTSLKKHFVQVNEQA